MLANKAAGAMFKYTFSFDDMLLVPKYSDIRSRKEVDTSTSMGTINCGLPVVSSPMDTVTEVAMATAMNQAGGLGIIHRYNSIAEQSTLISRLVENGVVNPAAAVGASGDFLERSIALANAGAKILCVDIAHGHHTLMKDALDAIRQSLSDQVYIIAGNVAMSDGYLDLASWGADAVRVGIGGGSICSTRLQTGHGVPTLQSVFACYIAKSMAISNPDTAPDNFKPAEIIADGGIRNTGDIVKSLAAGADMAMLGSMLAGTTESPGEMFVNKDGKKYKAYRGMASRDAQMKWRGKTSSLEGISTTIPYKGSVADILSEIDQNIKSGLSYSGARNIQEFRDKCEFIVQTAAGQKESNTHILERR